jgi:hypothetical protein
MAMTGPEPRPEVQDLPSSTSTTPTPTEPVSPVGGGSASAPAGRRWRWAAAIAVVTLVTGATVAAAALLTGASAPSTVARWAPADAVAFVEVRADLPGDQRAALGELLSAFPGFDDQSILDRKLTDLYDRLIADATDDRQTWTADVAPWFAGQLGFAAGPLPAGAPQPGAAKAPKPGLAVATTTDAAAAIDWVARTATDEGLTVTRGTVGAAATATAEHGGRSYMAAAVADVLLVGDTASVEAAIARNGAGGLASTARFGEAIASLPADRLSMTYVDLGSIVDRLGSLGGERTQFLGQLIDMVPAWAAGVLRAEPDALVGEGTVPRTEAMPDVPNGTSRLPERLPASTIVLVEGHAVGQSLLESLERSGEADASPPPEIGAALGALGGLEGLLGWMDEVGLVVLGGDEPLTGVAAIATDAEEASNLGRSLRNLATLGGLAPTDVAHGSATITTIDFTAADGVLPGLGPDHDGPSSVSWTVAGDLVVVGTDPGFVRAVLDAQSGDTLSDVAKFRELVDRAGASHRGLAWADLDAIEAASLEGLTAAERAEFEREVQPYLAPFEALVGVVARDGDIERARGLVVIDEGS